MRTIPVILVTCSLLWSVATLAASPAKKDVPATTDIQTQDVSTPGDTSRSHMKHKVDDASSQNTNAPQVKTVRDSSGKFLKKDKTVEVPKTATEPGATARCQDGSLSHSSQHRGACSRHGGVAQWLNE
ncbi:DUF3761 domain-containing protein [Enterobacter asburiae]|uniref:DUF3761 domain-containing protein n=1 Tax=Enterobacter asburiae TaxID=61645 RepID=UPI0030F3B2CC